MYWCSGYSTRVIQHKLTTDLRSLVLYTWYRHPGFQVLLRVSGWQLGLGVKGNVVRKIK